MFLRRLGTAPQNRGCTEACQCPDLFELNDGSFAVIGTDITELAKPLLPASAGCGPTERIVQLPRTVLLAARLDIPVH